MDRRIEILGRGKYAVSESQQFVDREGNLVRAVKGSPKPIPVGEAYAFYDCRKPTEQIEGVVNTIRRQMPEELELYLLNEADLLPDSKLREIADEARNDGMTQVIRAYYPTKSNREAADELTKRVLNQFYQSSLYREGEAFNGKVVYKEGKEYVSKKAHFSGR